MWNLFCLVPALAFLGYGRLLQLARQHGQPTRHHPELVGLVGILFFAGAIGSMYQDCNESAAKREREEASKRATEEAQARVLADQEERRRKAEEKANAAQEKKAREDALTRLRSLSAPARAQALRKCFGKSSDCPDDVDLILEAAQSPTERRALESSQKVLDLADRRANAPLLCRDGSESPTCTCGGPRRGCCSHHGGVAGCVTVSE